MPFVAAVAALAWLCALVDMRYFGPILLIFAVAAAWAYAGRTIAFDPDHAITEVNVVINGRAEGRFGVDTGADYLYIDREFARRHGLPLESARPMRPTVGIDGASDAALIPIQSLEIGGQRLDSLDGVVIDMRKIVTNPLATPPEGLLGFNILRRFYVTIDFPHRTMTFDLAEPPVLHSDSLPSVPFRMDRHLIVVDAVLNDSIVVPMALDYCATHVVLTPDLAQRVGFKARKGRPSARTMAKISLGGLITTGNVVVGVKDISAFARQLGGTEIQGLIGASFLYRHKITIDYKRNLIYLHPKS